MPFDNFPVADDDVLRTLIAVDEILSDESRHCQRVFNSGDKHCLAGAWIKAKGISRKTVTWEHIEPLANALGFKTAHELFSFNDKRPFPEVKALLAQAIARRLKEKHMGGRR